MYARHVEERVRDALADTRVVLLAGPRQAGKTTLARKLASALGMTFLTLDNATTLSAARRDPVGMIRALDRAVIDEVQRAPELLMAVKESVDMDPRPGRFLLTGSANLMTLPRVADSLAGRMEVVQLLPLSQGELQRTRTRFLERAFRGRVEPPSEPLVGDELLRAVVAGGYPEAVSRRSWERRQDWYLEYVDAIVRRDVREVANIEHLQQMPRLLRVLAEHAGQLVNHSAVGAPLGINHVTAQRYTRVFEQLFLVALLQPWYTNRLKRLTKTAKLHFLDSGLLAAIRDLSPEELREDRTPFGSLLETFVLAELMKSSNASGQRYEFSHYRDKDQNEVDIVVEDRRGRVVGLKIKASATVAHSDFNGLRRLATASGDRFALGAVLYDHDTVVPFAEHLFAVPLSALWK